MMKEKKKVLEDLYLLKNLDLSELTEREHEAFNSAIESYETYYVEKLYHHGIISKEEYLKILNNDIAELLLRDSDTVTCPICDNYNVEAPLVVTSASYIATTNEGETMNTTFYRAYCANCGHIGRTCNSPEDALKDYIDDCNQLEDDNSTDMTITAPITSITLKLPIMNDDGDSDIITKEYTSDDIKYITDNNIPEEDGVAEYLYIRHNLETGITDPYFYYKSSKDIFAPVSTTVSIETLSDNNK